MSVAARMGPGTAFVLLLLQELLQAFTLLQYLPELLVKFKPNPALNEQCPCQAAWPLESPTGPGSPGEGNS